MPKFLKQFAGYDIVNVDAVKSLPWKINAGDNLFCCDGKLGSSSDRGTGEVKPLMSTAD